MKKNLLTPLYMIAFAAIIGMSWSCTKQNASPPAPQTNNLSEDVLQAGEVSSAVVVPGIYSILKFTDTGDDITSEYTGYTFNFRSDGTLIATTNLGAVFTGTWKENSAQTKMAINIRGNAALKNLSDDNWTIVLITDHRISLRKPGPDRVIFAK